MPTLRDSGDMNLVTRIAALQDKTSFKELHWTGRSRIISKSCVRNPRVTRTAFQRIYDMILSHGKTEYIDNKKRLIRYHFFHDEPNGGRDAVYGLDVPLMKLVNVFKSAAQGYGTEKRVICCTGRWAPRRAPSCGCSRKASRSTRARPEGALYTFSWCWRRSATMAAPHREVFKLPDERGPAAAHSRGVAQKVFADLARPTRAFQVPVRGISAPPRGSSSRELMTEYKGDFAKVMSHVASGACCSARRTASASAPSSPRTRKNQDSTELTGDVNYRKIAEYGSDSRSTRLQLRRRVQHRQPRHHRVRRGAQSSTWPSSTICWGARRSTGSSRRSSRRPTSTR